MSELDDQRRYHRQRILPGIGDEGQRRLAAARVLVVGCGALGSVVIDQLARAGVGTIVCADRDIVEATNLQRQILYTEVDVEEAIPKAAAAARAVGRINRQVRVEPHVTDVRATTLPALADGVDVIVDGLDNFETRYLLNDHAVATATPYVYGGAVGTTGLSLVILPHPGAEAGTATDAHADADSEADADAGAGAGAGAGAAAAAPRRIRWTEAEATPCLRCLFPAPPPAGSTATCDTAGVLGPVVTTVAARQAAETIKLIAAGPGAVDRSMTSIDLWSGDVRAMDVSAGRRADCPCCAERRFDWRDGTAMAQTEVLCGRGAVQVLPPAGLGGAAAGGTASGGSASGASGPGGAAPGGAGPGGAGTGGAGTAAPGADLDRLAERLSTAGTFTRTEFLVRGTLADVRSEAGEAIELLLFADGRALIRGTDSPDEARRIYARYVGG